MKLTKTNAAERILSLILLCASVVNAQCQGGIVVFDNIGLSSPPDRLVRFASASTPGNPFGTNQAPAVGLQLRAQLYYGASTADEGSLVAVSTAPATLRPSTTSFPGTWFPNGARYLTGFTQGDTVNLQVRVWDVTFGSTYEDTGSNGVQRKSLMFRYSIQFEPAHSYSMENFQGFTIDIPEPSAILLTAFTVIILLFLLKGPGASADRG